MATGGSDAEAVQEAQAAGTTLPGALHSPGSVAATPPASLQIPHANGDLVSPGRLLHTFCMSGCLSTSVPQY